MLEVLPRDALVDAGSTLGGAMADDPFYRWLSPDDARRRAFLDDLMARLLRMLHPHGHVYGTGADGLEAVIALTPPGAFPLPVGPSLAFALRTAVARPSRRPPLGRLAQGARLLAQLDHAHPPVPHWWVAIAGVRPDAQGRGHGRRLVFQALRLAADSGTACHLETTNPVNVPFYEHLGFRVIEQLDLSPAPPAWTMVAEPAR